MGFKTAVIEIRPASVGTGVKVTLRKHRAGAKLEIYVSEKLGAGELNWRPDDRLEVMIGDAEHHGLLRLRKNNSIGQATVVRRNTMKGGYLAVSLGHQAAFVTRSEAARWCQWEKVEDGWVEVVLPKWADETAPRRSTPQPGPVDLHRVPGSPGSPGRPKQNVTAALMGDPAPGRREALEKMR